MGDDYRDSGATQVLPKAPASPPPPVPPGRNATGEAPEPRGMVPWWVVLVVGVAVALLTAAVSIVVAMGRIGTEQDLLAARLRQDDARMAQLTSELESATAALEAAGTVAKPGTEAQEPTPAAPAATAKTERQFCLVKTVSNTSGAYRITVDYVQLLTGQAAQDAAAARGDTIEGESFYILNDNTKLRTFDLASDADVRLLDWAGATGDQSTRVSPGEFMDVMTGGANPQQLWRDAYYWVTVKNGTTVTKVEEQYFP